MAERLKDWNLVGTGRFELPTPRTPSECSTRLSHVPFEISNLRGNSSKFEYSLWRKPLWDLLISSGNVSCSQMSHRQHWSGTSTVSNGFVQSARRKTS